MVIKIFQLLNRLLKFVLNLLFLIQIILMVLVFLTASYSLFSLLNSDMMQFAEPIANACANFIKIFFQSDMQFGDVYFDGSLFAFDILSIVVVLILSKLKYYINVWISTNNIAINFSKNNNEKKFNMELQNDLETHLKKINSTAILIQFQVKNLISEFATQEEIDARINEKTNEAFNIYYSVLKNISGCELLKVNNNLLIKFNRFDKIDNIIGIINLTNEKTQQTFKSKKWLIITYIAVDVFESNANFNKDIYPIIEKLVNLHVKNEILCLSNFRLRYEVNNPKKYTFYLKGSYDINGSDDVWSMVKKN